MKDFLTKVRYSVALLAAGILLVFFSYYSLSGEWNKLQIQPRSSVSLTLLTTGIALALLSAAIYLIEKQDLTLIGRCKLTKTEKGFRTSYKQTEIYVEFGPLHDMYL